MKSGLRGDPARNLTEACRAYWRRNGVPEARIAEMSAELEDHLHEALADGKNVEDVTGPDVEKFAEDWAAPNRPSRSLGQETLDVLSDAVVALAVVMGMSHLLVWSMAIPVSLKDAVGALLLALLFARLFAYLRAPSDAPPDSEESVLDRYPRRPYNFFMWSLVALWGAHLLLPIPETVLLGWPVQATLALPLLAVLVRGAKRLVAGDGDAAGTPRPSEDVEEDQTQQVMSAVADCAIHWRRMRIPQETIGDMLHDLDEYIGRATDEGRSVRSVVGDDTKAFAEAWAEEHGAEPDPEPDPEPTKDVISGWVLSFSACATVLATFAHIMEWSLYVPVAWIVGVYLFIVAGWFGQPVADLLDRAKSWRYSPWKSMLAAALIVLVMAAVAGIMALFFMVVGPQIPFEWPWYATVVCALVACSIVAVWVWRFSREEAEREKRRDVRGQGGSESV